MVVRIECLKPRVDRQTEQQSNRNKRMDLTRFFCDDNAVNTWSVRDRSKKYCKGEWNDAAKEGDLHKIILLHLQHVKGCTKGVMTWAAALGHLDVVIWLHENRKGYEGEGCTKRAMDGAAENGRLDVVIWLHENRGEECTGSAMDWAAKKGHLDVVIWLHENRSERCTELAMDLAALNGHLHVVIWLHENRSEGCTNWAIYYAATNGHPNVVKWLEDHAVELGFPEWLNLIRRDDK
jgi:hypothetical protein